MHREVLSRVMHLGNVDMKTHFSAPWLNILSNLQYGCKNTVAYADGDILVLCTESSLMMIIVCGRKTYLKTIGICEGRRNFPRVFSSNKICNGTDYWGGKILFHELRALWFSGVTLSRLALELARVILRRWSEDRLSGGRFRAGHKTGHWPDLAWHSFINKNVMQSCLFTYSSSLAEFVLQWQFWVAATEP